MSDVFAFHASEHLVLSTIKQECRESLLLILLNNFSQVNTKVAKGLICGCKTVYNQF